MKLNLDSGGAGAPSFLLLHGLGATRSVWTRLTPLIERAGASWIAPDLRGHGRSPWAEDYPLDGYAADAAAIAKGAMIILGHSMGGVVALRLASGAFGWRPRAAFALGVKIRWSAEELEKLSARAETPAKRFADEQEAARFFLRVNGLADVAGASFAVGGVVRDADGWRLAVDSRTSRIAAPEMAELTANAACPIHLAAGDRDPMTSLAEMQLFDPKARLFEDCGHNAMAEAPEKVWEWVQGLI